MKIKKPMVYVNTDHLLTSPFITYLRKRTALDLAFQSEERWEHSDKSNFITSLITGMAPSKIVVANNKACMDNSESGSDDYNYFHDWHSQGYINTSVDGNNRTISIQEYLNGEVSIESGDYMLPDGKVIEINPTNNTWTKHPKEFIDYVSNHTRVTVAEYMNASRDDLKLLFLNINDGKSLNKQEMRNATLVPFAGWVRDMTKKTYKDMLKKVFPTPNQKKRRTIDDFIVDMAVFCTYGTKKNIHSGTKDKAYEDKSTVSQTTKKSEKIILDFSNFVKNNVDKKLKSHTTLFNLFMLYNHIIENKYLIRDTKKFYEWFMSKENKRLGDTNPIMTTKTGESKSYLSCCKTLSSPEATARFDYIKKDLNEVLEEIVFLKDNNRIFNKTERYQLWQRQNGVCTITGKSIPESEINDDSKWAADHIIPFSKGGETALDNGQLIDKKANLQKSNKLEVIV